jgi:hypothetical protein
MFDSEARLRRLEDIEEIRRLKLEYFEACDGGFGGIPSHVPEEIARTFAEDGAWDGGLLGELTGRAAITEHYRARPQCLAFTLLSEPAIEVDGDEATGRWNMVVCLEYRNADGPEARLFAGVHHDRYVRTDEGWKIAHTRFVPAIVASRPHGWSGSS